MTSTCEKLEKNQAKLKITISAERFEEGMKYSYNKNKNKMSIPGFRKGKVPRSLLEKQFGPELFYEDAVEYVFPDAYKASIKEHNLQVVSRPELESENIDKENGAELTVIVITKPDVSLGQYKGIEYSEVEAEVSETEIHAEIEKARDKNARMIDVTDRPIENGDTVSINFEGFVDGVAFDGGKGEDYELEIGSKTFIDTFEDQLIGKNIGDDIDVNVTFPSEYGKEELANKPALFKVEILSIVKKELPSIDDEFAKDVSEFETLDELKADIREKLQVKKSQARDRKIDEEILTKVSDNAQVDIPEVMIENEMNKMVQDFANRVSSQGIEFEQYLTYMGQDVKTFRESYRENAAFNVKARLVLETIAVAENIEPTEEEVKEEVKRVAQIYGVEEDIITRTIDQGELDGLETDLKVQKALKIIKDTAKSIS